MPVGIKASPALPLDLVPPALVLGALLALGLVALLGVSPAQLSNLVEHLEVCARIASKNHANGARNPLAQFRKAVSQIAPTVKVTVMKPGETQVIQT